ncbi:MAG: antibiotic biosynthesis monooxygenase [Rhodospirillaceae bacterium]|nr:antibiotic biosynthesis monooxygenase [Rhodospirillaceae bacterium]
MSFVLCYGLTAESPAEKLASALTALAAEIESLPGCIGVQVLRESGRADRFQFVESWTSEECHKLASDKFPKDAFGQVMGAVAEKPLVTSYEGMTACN